MSYSDDTIAHTWGYPENRTFGGFRSYPWWKVIQKPLHGPGSVTTWFSSKDEAYKWAAGLDGHLEIVGATWDEYEGAFL